MALGAHAPVLEAVPDFSTAGAVPLVDLEGGAPVKSAQCMSESPHLNNANEDVIMVRQNAPGRARKE